MTTKDAFDLKDHEIIKLIMTHPDLSQASVADQLKIAVGTVNRRLKKLEKQGFLKTNPHSRRKRQYTVTEKGTQLSNAFEADRLQMLFSAFQQVRNQSLQLISKWRAFETMDIPICGEGDAVEIFRLIALDQGFNPIVGTFLSTEKKSRHVVAEGTNLTLIDPESESESFEREEKKIEKHN